MDEDNEIKSLCVNTPSSKILEKIKQFSKGLENKEHIAGKKIIVPNSTKINIWEVSRRIFIIGQIWRSSTESLSHKNNINDTKNYLDDLFKAKYLVVSMEKHLEDFERVFYCPDLWYDLEYINRICIALKAWMDINESNVIVIEINYSVITLFAILLDAILVYCGYENSIVENIFVKNDVLSNKTNNINTIFRYKRYYTDLIHSKRTEIRNVLLLHQIIISNYHHFENLKNFRVQLRIFQKNTIIRTVHDVDDIGVVYKDDYYIVFTNIDVEASGDITLGLYFISDTSEKEIFQFAFNGLCHDQGLYRFKRNDILSKYKYKFTDEFKLDIVFLESDKYFTTKKTMRESDLIQGIRHLTEFTNQKRSDVIFDRYNTLGYNRIIAKLIAQMKYSDDDVEELILSLTNKGYDNLICQSKPLHVSQIKFKSDAPINKPIEREDQSYPLLREPIDRECIYKDIKGKEILTIEPITEDIYREKDSKGPQKKMPIRKKTQPDFNEKPPELVSLKPLHWTPIISNTKTVFNELNDVIFDFDIKKFERHFCVKNAKINEEKGQLTEHYHVIDPKRLFLVSLALNHLNKKEITHNNVYEILKNCPNHIQIQDLLNIERVFPTYEETYLLASCDVEKLSPEEKSMLNFSRLAEVKKIVEIMIFERKFFDEIFLIDDLLERYSYTLDKIIESKEIRVLLKALLDVGNIINYEYSLRRRKSGGFRLSCIYLFMDYKGKDDYHLLEFIMSSIKQPNFLENLQRDFKYLEMLRKESFSKIKDKINLFIEIESSKLEVYYSLEYDREDFTNLFIFSTEKLSSSKAKYMKCQEKIRRVIEMFGENEKKSISDVFENVHDLLKGLEEHCGDK